MTKLHVHRDGTWEQRLGTHTCTCILYQSVYVYTCTCGHNEDDSSIMPIEEVTLTPHDKTSLSAKRLEREGFWYKTLCTVYPYGLNDNVLKVVYIQVWARCSSTYTI